MAICFHYTLAALIHVLFHCLFKLGQHEIQADRGNPIEPSQSYLLMRWSLFLHFRFPFESKLSSGHYHVGVAQWAVDIIYHARISLDVSAILASSMDIRG